MSIPETIWSNTDQSLSIWSNDTIIIQNNKIPYYTNIVSRFNELTSMCFDTNWVMCPYFEYCNSYSVIYVDNLPRVGNDVTADVIMDELNSNSKEIKSMLTFVYGDNNTIEIFDNCTDPVSRKKGYFKHTMNTVKTSGLDIWVGVKVVNNPDVKTNLNIYINQGFENPTLTNTTPDKSFYFPYHFIGLSFYHDKTRGRRIKQERQNKSVLLNSAINLISYYERCITTVFVQNITLRYLIENFILDDENVKYSDREYGGNFILGNDNVLFLDHSSIQRGEFESVQINSGAFDFHTHHEQCYKKHNCVLGYPSSADYALWMAGSDSNVLSFVIAIEGVYATQVTKMCKEYYNSLSKNNKDKFFNGVNNVLTERYEKGVLVMKDDRDVGEYLNHINNLKSSEIFQYIKKSDPSYPHYFKEFQLFIVNFASATDIFNTNENLAITISNSFNNNCK